MGLADGAGVMDWLMGLADGPGTTYQALRTGETCTDIGEAARGTEAVVSGRTLGLSMSKSHSDANLRLPLRSHDLEQSLAVPLRFRRPDPMDQLEFP